MIDVSIKYVVGFINKLTAMKVLWAHILYHALNFINATVMRDFIVNFPISLTYVLVNINNIG